MKKLKLRLGSIESLVLHLIMILFVTLLGMLILSLLGSEKAFSVIIFCTFVVICNVQHFISSVVSTVKMRTEIEDFFEAIEKQERKDEEDTQN